MPVTSQDIVTQLPYVRRFARAVTGSQKSGDAYVAEALEAIIADPALVSTEGRTRIALFKTVLSVINSVRVNRVGDQFATGKPDARLQTMAPRARQAFLLVAVEELTAAEAAEVMGVSGHELSQLLDEAGREIASQIATDILIIEDEPLIAFDLQAIVTRLGHRVIAVARTRSQAVDVVKHQSPGLILADVQLADDTSGIDAVNDILTDHSLPVVFITAYPERLLTGTRPEPAFLITKPFQPSIVTAIVSQALFFDQRCRAS